MSAIAISDKNITLAALQSIAKGSTASSIHLDVISVATYSDFVSVVERAVHFALRKLSLNPELRQEHSEDQLTIEVVNMLSTFDLDAAHEAKVGGHCDISINGPYDFLWLGEAKKHVQAYAWLLQGFQQLDARYSTGLAGQDTGGLIVYSNYPRIDKTMASWRQHLLDHHPNISCEEVCEQTASFLSAHVHQGTGRNLSVRHFACSLYFRPTDQDKKKKDKSK